MTEITSTRPTHRTAVERIREAERFALNVPFVGHVAIPRPEQLAYFAGLGALVALELIEWPVAIAIAAGHILAEGHHHRVLHELGEALEEA